MRRRKRTPRKLRNSKLIQGGGGLSGSDEGGSDVGSFIVESDDEDASTPGTREGSTSDQPHSTSADVEEVKAHFECTL